MPIRGKGLAMPHYNICDDTNRKELYFGWYDRDSKHRYKYAAYRNRSREEAMKNLEDLRYEQQMRWLAENKGVVSAFTNTIVSIDDDNISLDEMSLATKNFKFDLLSFDPEWSERGMFELLSDVKNPYDFKQVLESNSEKICIKTYHTSNMTYWKASDVCKLLGYPIKNTTQRIKDADLEKGFHYCNYNDIATEIVTLQPAESLRKDQLMLTQRGLMKLLLYSDKPVAKTFKLWIELVLEKISDLSNKILDNYESKRDMMVEELNRQKHMLEMIKAEKKHHMYIFTNDYIKNLSCINLV